MLSSPFGFRHPVECTLLAIGKNHAIDRVWFLAGPKIKNSSQNEPPVDGSTTKSLRIHETTGNP
jgi:hypothetical protein